MCTCDIYALSGENCIAPFQHSSTVQVMSELKLIFRFVGTVHYSSLNNLEFKETSYSATALY